MYSLTWTDYSHSHTVVVAHEGTLRTLYAILTSHEARVRWHTSPVRVFDASTGQELDPENNWSFKEKSPNAPK